MTSKAWKFVGGALSMKILSIGRIGNGTSLFFHTFVVYLENLTIKMIILKTWKEMYFQNEPFIIGE